MKLVSKKLCLVLVSTAFLFVGCTKKPARPDPSATAIGPTPGGAGGVSNMAPTDLTLAPGTDLISRLPDGAFEDDKTIRGLIQPVYFDFDRADIRQAERPKLQAAKEYLDTHPGARILLEGYCDWRGTAEYNLALGDRRANSAKRFLESLGVPADRLESSSKGSIEASKNADDATMAKDRRAEVVILKPQAPGGPGAPL